MENPLDKLSFDVNSLMAYPEFNWDCVEGLDDVYKTIVKTYEGIITAISKGMAKTELTKSEIAKDILIPIAAAIDNAESVVNDTQQSISQSLNGSVAGIQSSFDDFCKGVMSYVYWSKGGNDYYEPSVVYGVNNTLGQYVLGPFPDYIVLQRLLPLLPNIPGDEIDLHNWSNQYKLIADLYRDGGGRFCDIPTTEPPTLNPPPNNPTFPPQFDDDSPLTQPELWEVAYLKPNYVVYHSPTTRETRLYDFNNNQYNLKGGTPSLGAYYSTWCDSPTVRGVKIIPAFVPFDVADPNNPDLFLGGYKLYSDPNFTHYITQFAGILDNGYSPLYNANMYGGCSEVGVDPPIVDLPESEYETPDEPPVVPDPKPYEPPIFPDEPPPPTDCNDIDYRPVIKACCTAVVSALKDIAAAIRETRIPPTNEDGSPVFCSEYNEEAWKFTECAEAEYLSLMSNQEIPIPQTAPANFGAIVKELNDLIEGRI